VSCLPLLSYFDTGQTCPLSVDGSTVIDADQGASTMKARGVTVGAAFRESFRPLAERRCGTSWITRLLSNIFSTRGRNISRSRRY
jgi:hypothetical protein